MASATITQLKTAQIKKNLSKPVSEKRPSKKAILQNKYQKYAAIGIGAVGSTLTALSLTHLAHGVEMVAHCQTWESWAMAAGIDLGFISLELATIVAPNIPEMKKYANPTIIGTLIASAIMNAFGFTEHAQTLAMQIAGISLGIAIPAMIYALTKASTTLYLKTK